MDAAERVACRTRSVASTPLAPEPFAVAVIYEQQLSDERFGGEGKGERDEPV